MKHLAIFALLVALVAVLVYDDSTQRHEARSATAHAERIAAEAERELRARPRCQEDCACWVAPTDQEEGFQVCNDRRLVAKCVCNSGKSVAGIQITCGN